MIGFSIIIVLFFVLLSIEIIRGYHYPTYNNIRYTALRNEELHKIIENESNEDAESVEFAKDELKRRGYIFKN